MDPHHPLAKFSSWLNAAQLADPLGAKAMCLSTSGASRPSARIVILRTCDARGPVFTTNANSAKARQLAANPCAALTLYWPSQFRQVRIEGRATRVPQEEAALLFSRRRRDAQIGEWLSERMSDEMHETPEQVESTIAQVKSRFADVKDIPMPPFFAGYRVEWDLVEFWEGGSDVGKPQSREVVSKDASGVWQMKRIYG
ncbi:hypothetical protein HDU98_001235 [Podochytrium sp. JEL0797]|nr:hypothetical protein HDU98_001235 [Podochytrium sp. JEL0797]